MIDFELTEEQQALREMARRFAAREIAPHAAEWDAAGKFPAELYPKAWENGLVTCTLPEEYGGVGLGVVEQCLIMEELACADAGIAVSLAVSPLGLAPVALAGTPEQKQRLIGRFCAEPIWGALAVSEAGAGSDVAALATTARRAGDGYVLNGTKMFITNAAAAEVIFVLAYTNRAARHKGMSLFAVPRGPGVRIGKKEDKMGQRASDTVEVVFEDVPLAAADRIGAEGEGFKLVMATFDKSRPVVGAVGVGIARAALEHAVRYAGQRVQFGRPIAAQQAIQFMLANVARAIDAARLLVWRAAWLTDRGRRSSAEAAMAKSFASSLAVDATRTAIQVFGGYGYSREYPVEKLYRDAKVLEIYEGTTQIQELIIARSLFD